MLGGTLSANYQSFKIHPAYSLSYQYTRQGLIRACSDKMVTSSIEENQRLRKAICVLSSLSNWAQNNKNLSGDIFDNFIQEIVPENHTMFKILPHQYFKT